MKKPAIYLAIFVVVLLQVIPVSICLAWSSGSFHQEGDDIFDDWHVCRTSPGGEDGYLREIYTSPGWPPAEFRPLIVFESLGDYVDTAYRLGEQFADKYPDRHQRAEKIFEYVRDRVQYVNDIDQFDVDEYAQNADEVANTIQKEGIAYGDCEEHAILLAVIYLGAGYRSAIIDCPRHVGVIVYLPDYRKANVIFNLNGEPGWVWAEATGNTNPFGWCPVGQLNEPILAYEISDEHIPLWQPPSEEEPLPVPTMTGGGPDLVSITLPAIIVAALTGIIILFIRRRRA